MRSFEKLYPIFLSLLLILGVSSYFIFINMLKPSKAEDTTIYPQSIYKFDTLYTTDSQGVYLGSIPIHLVIDNQGNALTIYGNKLQKLNSSKVLQWTQTFTSTVSNPPWNLYPDSSGNVFVSGVYQDSLSIGSSWTVSNGGGNSIGFLSKFDTDGNFLWGTDTLIPADNPLPTVTYPLSSTPDVSVVWDLNETSDNSCGNGNDVCDNTAKYNGDVVGTVPTTVDPGVFTGREFDGSNGNYIDFGDNHDFKKQSLVIEARVMKSAGTCGTYDNCTILSKGSSGNQGFSLSIVSGKLQLRINDQGGDTLQYVQGSTTIVDGTWHTVAGVVDGVNKTLRVYVDGVLDGSTSFTEDISYFTAGSGSAHVKIGNGNDNNDLPFRGIIDNVKYYGYNTSTEYLGGASNVQTDSDGSAYVFLSSFGNRMIAKFNSSGTIQWFKSLPSDLLLNKLEVFGDSVYVLSDGTSSPSNYTIQKFSATDGTLVWEKVLIDAESGNGSADIGIDSGGNLILFSTFYDSIDWNFDGIADATTTNSSGDIFIAKYDSDGNNLWGEAFSSSSGATTPYNPQTKMAINHENNIIFIAYVTDQIHPDPENSSTTITVSNSPVLIELDPSGKYVYSQVFSTTTSIGSSFLNGITFDPENNLYVWGSASSGNSLDFDINNTSETENPSTISSGGFLVKYSLATAITHLSSNLHVTDSSNDRDLSNPSTLNKNEREAILLSNESGTNIPAAKVDVDMSSSRIWNEVIADVNTETRAVLIHNLASAPGVTGGTYSMLLKKEDTDNKILVCPNAVNINNVVSGCTGGYVVSTTGISTETISGQNYWILPGLTGTGAMPYHTFIDTGDGTPLSPYEISTCEQLQDINLDLTSSYTLVGNVDCSETLLWNNGAGFVPLGADPSTPFSGSLNGNNYTISGLYINVTSEDWYPYQGMFGDIEGGSVQDLKMTNVTVNAPYQEFVGGFAGAVGGTMGTTAESSISNVHLSNITVNGGSEVGGFTGFTALSTFYGVSTDGGNVSGGEDVGGLVGNVVNANVSIDYGFTNVNVSSSGDNLGGFVGKNSGTINHSHALGSVTGNTGNSDTGGFIGLNNTGEVSNSYSTGDVTGGNNIGGFVGLGSGNGSISTSYSTGDVLGTDQIGGFCGTAYNSTVHDSYAMGEVTGTQIVGGFCGVINGADIENVYSRGSVTGSSSVGGLIGSLDSATLVSSYYNTQTSGQSDTGKGTPITTAQMAIKSTFTDWDFDTIWTMGMHVNTTSNPLSGGTTSIEGQYIGSPLFKSQSSDVTVTAVSALGYDFSNWTEDSTIVSTNPVYSFNYTSGYNQLFDTRIPITTCQELQNMSSDLTADYYLANDIDCSDTVNWNSGDGFIPVGRDINSPFSGSLDGNGHTISNVTIYNSTNKGYTTACIYAAGNGCFYGLFGLITGSVQNLNLDNINVESAAASVGTLAGGLGTATKNGFVSNVHVLSGSVSYATVNQYNGIQEAGGLIGLISTQCYRYSQYGWSYVETCINTAEPFLAASSKLEYSSSAATVTCWAGDYDGISYSCTGGGLVGYSQGFVTNSFATGSVSSGATAGGLVGANDGRVEESFATGDVSVTGEFMSSTGYINGGVAGGLIGGNGCPVESSSDPCTSGYAGTVENVYALGDVNSVARTGGGFKGYGGGLIGSFGGLTVTNAYAAGSVATTDYVGGLIGAIADESSVVSSYYDTDTTGQSDSGKGVGESSGVMKTQATYTGWNFTSIWGIGGINGGYPYLRNLKTEALVDDTGNGGSCSSSESSPRECFILRDFTTAHLPPCAEDEAGYKDDRGIQMCAKIISMTCTGGETQNSCDTLATRDLTANFTQIANAAPVASSSNITGADNIYAGKTLDIQTKYSDDDGADNLNRLYLRLRNPSGTNIEYYATNNGYSQTSQVPTAVSGSTYVYGITYDLTYENPTDKDITVTWHIRVKWNWTRNITIQYGVRAIDKLAAASVYDYTSSTYRYENRLIFTNSLVAKDYNNMNLNSGDWTRANSSLYFSGVRVVYYGTTNVYPPDSDFDVYTINNESQSWTDANSSGRDIAITATTPDLTSLGDTYAFSITNIPSGGSDLSNTSFDIKTDKIAPIIYYLNSSTYPDGSLTYQATTGTFSWSVADNESGIKGIWYLLDNNNGTSTEIVKGSGTQTTLGTVTISDIANGIWYFHLMAEDNCGNKSLATYMFTVGANIPDIVAVIGLYNNVWQNIDGGPVISWTDPNSPSGDTYFITTNGTTPSASNYRYTTVNPTYDLPTQNEGVTIIKVIDKDGNGVYSIARSFTIKYDITAPTLSPISSSTYPDSSTTYNVSTGLFNWTVTDALSGVRGVWYLVDNYTTATASSILSNGIKASSNEGISVTNIENGSWYLHIVAQDNCGNTSLAQDYHFVVNISDGNNNPGGDGDDGGGDDGGGNNGGSVEQPDNNNEPSSNTIVNNIVSTISDVVKSIPVSEQTAQNVTTTALAVVTVTPVVSAGLGSSYTIAAIVKFFSGLLVFFKIGHKKRNIGVVYDSLTKEPLRNVVVRFYTPEGKLMATEVTNVYGIFETLLENGRYKIVAQANGYKFPTSIVLGNTDSPYENIYRGEVFDYDSSTGVDLSIPIDPLNKAMPEYVGVKTKSLLFAIFNVISNILVFGGFAFSIISYIKDSSIINLVLLLFYLVLLVINIVLMTQNRYKFGTVKDMDGKAEHNVAIGLMETQFDTIYAKRVSSAKGKYRFIVPGGTYKLVSLDPVYDITSNESLEISTKEGKITSISMDIIVLKRS
jgi:hypothetical protein